MTPQPVPIDRLIAQIAESQHGVISIAQLYAIGLSHEAVAYRVRIGRLHRLFRGVYSVGHSRPSRLGWWKAATLACGDGAVLSHRSAAELWGLLKPSKHPIDVTVPGRTGRSQRRGIAIHRPRSLPGSATTLESGIAVTTTERTFSDLKRVVSPPALRNAIRAAEIAGLPVGDYGKLTKRTRSELEIAFLALCRRHRLPEPEVNVRVGRFRPDFLWRAERLIVETDGRRFHRGELATQEDAERDREFERHGYEVLRFGYWEIVEEPRRVAGTIRARLARS